MSQFNYEVIDNFLSPQEHELIENIMVGPDGRFAWYLNDYKSSDNDLMPMDSLYNFQFTHVFHVNNNIASDWYSQIAFPLVRKLRVALLLRIQANLNPMTKDIVKYGWHVDFPNYGHKTAVYYVNSNNGKTIFKNGLEVDSVANRIVIFDPDMLHTATSCTDKKVRCVINLNYIEEKE
jgi:hypothetical protein